MKLTEKQLGDLAAIDEKEKQVKAPKEKYTQVFRHVEGEFETETWEYVCPNSDTGYQVLSYKEVDKIKYVRSMGYGSEAESRTWDWQEITQD